MFWWVVIWVWDSQTWPSDWTTIKAFSSWSFTLVRTGLLLLFSCSVVSDSLWPHGLQHARLPRPSLTYRVCSNSCSLSQWCHPTISSSVTPFFSCPQSFPASESFSVSQLFISGGQNIGASPSNEYSGLISSRIDWFDLLAVQGILRSLLQHHSSKASILWHSAFFKVQLSHPWTGKLGMLWFMGSQRAGHDWGTELTCCIHTPWQMARGNNCAR